MLSASQEGFRPGRDTERQLQYLVSLLEDAKLTRRNIYMVIFYLSPPLTLLTTAAFGTSSHSWGSRKTPWASARNLQKCHHRNHQP